ncbi:MAG TPA: type II secretion system protein GspE, partial [Hyphomonas sp.]|nr:type II secretion system protein GspE [Hyphomonas sp.]
MMRPQLLYSYARDKGFTVLPGRPSLTVAVREGADPMCLPEVRRVLGQPFQIEVHTPAGFEKLLTESFGSGLLDGSAAAAAEKQENLESLFDGIPQTEDLLAGDGDAPIVRLINGLLQDAVKRRASDIHIDPFEEKLSIRYRIDGELQEVLVASRRIAPPLVSRIKVMSRLDIAEKRMPQDGRIS